MLKIALASQSPRRKEILTKAGLTFSELSLKVSEFIDKNLTPEEQVSKIAKTKVEAAINSSLDSLDTSTVILTADTLVSLNSESLGKPETPEEAYDFLKKLSGKTHQVKTAYCLYNCKTKILYEGLVNTDVSFRELADTEILDYIASKEPFDKAGGYGIQGLGGKLVEKINGSYFNVVGLPIEDILMSLQKLNWLIDRKYIELSNHLIQIESQIAVAALSSHRSPLEIQLLAVSKKQSPEKIKNLFSLGQKYFGENYVQEALNKKELLKDYNIEWHFIGHLQKNKIKSVVGEFALIHSVDSFELAQKISLQAQKINHIQRILLEVNIADETTKNGFHMQDLNNQFVNLLNLTHIKIEGLMCLPPLRENKDDMKKDFQLMINLLNELNQTLMRQNPSLPSLKTLSMGTSYDFESAIECQSTLVRIGTSLMGERT